MIDSEEILLQQILKGFRRSKLRITEPRKAILQVLIAHHGPYTAEELHKKFIKKICDLATVYRSVTSLEKAQIIRKCEFGDGSARYELADKHHHHHVICTSCKKIEVLDDCELNEIDRFARKRGFSGVSHSLEFFGTCPACK